jgi:hypothetical protein
LARRIGLLGGSFRSDPFIGHLQLARDALKQLPLEEVRLFRLRSRGRKVQSPLPDTVREWFNWRSPASHFALDMHEISAVESRSRSTRCMRCAAPDLPARVDHGLGPIRAL